MPDTLGDRPESETWRVNDKPAFTNNLLDDETRAFDALELTFRTTNDVVRETVRPLRENAGSFDIRERSDGGFVAIDTADGANTHSIEAPDDKLPVRRQRRWLVADYDEEMIDTRGDRYEVELELIPRRSKPKFGSYEDDDRDEDEHWLFGFSAGDVATPAVSSEIIESHSDGVETISLQTKLHASQVRKLEESARRLFGVTTIEQFDGGSRAVDRSVGEVNTMYLDPPAGGDKTVDPGHYAVEAWETVWEDGDWYDVVLDVVSVDVPPPFSDDFSPAFEGIDHPTYDEPEYHPDDHDSDDYYTIVPE